VIARKPKQLAKRNISSVTSASISLTISMRELVHDLTPISYFLDPRKK